MKYNWRYVTLSGDYEIYDSQDPDTVLARVDTVKEIWPTIGQLEYNDKNKRMLEAIKGGSRYVHSELTDV